MAGGVGRQQRERLLGRDASEYDSKDAGLSDGAIIQHSVSLTLVWNCVQTGISSLLTLIRS